MNTKKLQDIFASLSLPSKFVKGNISTNGSFENRFEVEKVTLDNKLDLLFIKETRAGAIEKFLEMAKIIANKVDLPYVLVFSKIDAATGADLLKARVPFVDYQSNIFIPQLGTLLAPLEDLEPKKPEFFAPTEQAILIYLLLNPNSIIVPQSITEKTDIAIASVYRALRKFANLDWINSTHGEYSFNSTPAEIFEYAMPYFIDPLKETYYVKPEISDHLNMQKAGQYALGELTGNAISERTFAVAYKEYKALLLSQIINGNEIFNQKMDNLDTLEVWQYPSETGSNVVDPISLYLSLKDSTDETVKSENDKLRQIITLTLEENYKQ